MTLAEIARRAALWWLLFPALAVPVGLIARYRGHPSILRRFVPWVAIVPITLGAAYGGATAFGVLLACCLVMSLAELARLDGARRVSWTFVGAALLVSAPWLVLEWPLRQHVVPIASCVSAIALVGCFASLRRVDLFDARLALAVETGASLSVWLALAQRPDGFRFVLIAFSVVAIGDVMAFAIGRLAGRTHPFPVLSPQKTGAGYAGAVAGGILVVGLLNFALPELGWDQLIALAIALTTAGAIGDLAASAVKRRFGAKDFGGLLGLQGGVLDRLDSLLPAGVLMWWLS